MSTFLAFTIEKGSSVMTGLGDIGRILRGSSVEMSAVDVAVVKTTFLIAALAMTDNACNDGSRGISGKRRRPSKHHSWPVFGPAILLNHSE